MHVVKNIENARVKALMATDGLSVINKLENMVIGHTLS